MKGKRKVILVQEVLEKRKENVKHEVCELMCVKCKERWIGVYPQSELLKDAVCVCGAKGYIIKTGQTIEVE